MILRTRSIRQSYCLEMSRTHGRCGPDVLGLGMLRARLQEHYVGF